MEVKQVTERLRVCAVRPCYAGIHSEFACTAGSRMPRIRMHMKGNLALLS